MIKHLALPISLALLSGTALGQSNGWTLGGVGIYGGDLDGTSSASAFPIIQYDQGPWTFGGASLASYAFGDPDQGLRSEAGLGFDFGQDTDGAPKLGFAPTLEASAAYRFPYFELSADLERRIGEGAGNLITLGAASGYPISDTSFLAVSLDMEWADADRREASYGLSSAGTTGTSLSIASINSIGDQQSYILGVSFTTLSNDIGDLAFVDTTSLTELIFSYSYDL